MDPESGAGCAETSKYGTVRPARSGVSTQAIAPKQVDNRQTLSSSWSRAGWSQPITFIAKPTTRPPITEWVAAMSASILRRTGLGKPGHRARKLGTPYSESTLRLSPRGIRRAASGNNFNQICATPLRQALCIYARIQGQEEDEDEHGLDWTALHLPYIIIRCKPPSLRAANPSCIRICIWITFVLRRVASLELKW
ncbi:hypothetical protein BKA56DRAFT_613070 [Ilyonectria sp. MPI-CAGE-AT-0026]|nr:hypothetical protein BKA56DRAFT_613070 [Ilyonectria sp. MPI-CAGE-AT-0026]